MSNTPSYATSAVALDCERTLVLAIELSAKSWVLTAQMSGPSRTKARQSIAPIADALMAAVGHYRERAAEARHTIERVIAIYEGGWSGFWLAR
jgi:transposase